MIACVRFAILLCACVALNVATGQNTIGLPHISNYNKFVYKGGLQNWDFAQDKSGNIYIANNEGVLVFDGSYWRNYPLPNKTIVRAIYIGDGKALFAGGQDELGFYQPGKNGDLKYHSLVSLIPEKYRAFGDVWDIVCWQERVFFRTEGYIFEYGVGKMRVHTAASEWAFLGICNGKVYAHDFAQGILVYHQNGWVPLFSHNPLSQADPVTALLPVQKDRFIVATLKNGLYKYDGGHVLQPIGKSSSQGWLYCGVQLMEHTYALGTVNNGIRIVDTLGNTIQQFTRKDGLQNENILSVFVDEDKNIWAGLDNGIDIIHYNSAIKKINPLQQDGAGYTALIQNNALYLGTSSGVYRAGITQTADINFNDGAFQLLDKTRGQVWQLAAVDNHVLVGHHDGMLVVDGNEAKHILRKPGFWNFTLLPDSGTAPAIIAGNYKGIQFFTYNKGQFTPGYSIPDFIESSRYLVLDKHHNIWVSHPYHGVFKLSRTQGNTYQVENYTGRGLPGKLNNHIFKIKNELVAATEKGLYTFDDDKKTFQPANYYNNILGHKSVRYLKEDTEGNIWYISEKDLGVIDFSQPAQPVNYDITELNAKLLSGFEFIYSVNQHNMILGGERGFYVLDYPKYKQTNERPGIAIRKVVIINKKDSTLFGGYYQSLDNTTLQPRQGIFNIDNAWRNIRFEFSSSAKGTDQHNVYAYRLQGYETNWSGYSNKTEKEYTNLPGGDYVFEVKVKNKLGLESHIASYRFTVLPPWYLSAWAKIAYAVLAVLMAYLLYRWLRYKFIKQRQKFEAEQKRILYIHELEKSKNETEIISLKNEKLETEINFKNAELASSAMHIVKKGELIGKMKTELTQIMDIAEMPKANGAIKKLIKKLHTDEQIDEEWDHFSKHFDKVHSDFTVNLKKRHPNLTGNELKLCAYLRMNLSTKEIAQLMNISARGVEISRYRLRKKLGIPSEMKLFDYLMGV